MVTPSGPVRVVGFVAWSGTGKTTLLRTLIPLLNRQGLRVGLVKHAHHRFDVDTPGKDSYLLREAGANPVMLASRQRWVLMRETPGQDEAELWDLLARMGTDDLDLVLVEGFKHQAYPKVELHRAALGHPLLYPEDPDIVAVAADGHLEPPPPVALLDLNDPDGIARWLVGFAGVPGAG